MQDQAYARPGPKLNSIFNITFYFSKPNMLVRWVKTLTLIAKITIFSHFRQENLKRKITQRAASSGHHAAEHAAHRVSIQLQILFGQDMF